MKRVFPAIPKRSIKFTIPEKPDFIDPSQREFASSFDDVLALLRSHHIYAAPTENGLFIIDYLELMRTFPYGSDCFIWRGKAFVVGDLIAERMGDSDEFEMHYLGNTFVTKGEPEDAGIEVSVYVPANTLRVSDGNCGSIGSTLKNLTEIAYLTNSRLSLEAPDNRPRITLKARGRREVQIEPGISYWVARMPSPDGEFRHDLFDEMWLEGGNVTGTGLLTGEKYRDENVSPNCYRSTLELD